jgi:hypothetical protein
MRSRMLLSKYNGMIRPVGASVSTTRNLSRAEVAGADVMMRLCDC